MRSFMGRAVSCLWGRGFHWFLLVMESIFFSFRRFVISFMGADIQRLPVLTLCVRPRQLRPSLVKPTLDAVLLMNMPRNLALSALVLVISVFSSDNSRSSVSRNSWISFFISRTLLFGPQTPINQSSAYRTYSILMYLGLGMVVLNRRLLMTNRRMVSFFSSSLIFLFFLVRAIWFDILLYLGLGEKVLSPILFSSSFRFSLSTY